MNIRADTKRFFTGTGQQYYADLESVSNVWQCASSCSSISGVNALSFAGRLITSGNETVALEVNGAVIHGDFLVENRGDSLV